MVEAVEGRVLRRAEGGAGAPAAACSEGGRAEGLV